MSTSSDESSNSMWGTNDGHRKEDLQKFAAELEDAAMSVVVFGASGHLAKQKILPAIFDLYCKSLIPAHSHLFGYARSKMTDAQFRETLRPIFSKMTKPEEFSMGEKESQEKELQKSKEDLSSSSAADADPDTDKGSLLSRGMQMLGIKGSSSSSSSVSLKQVQSFLTQTHYVAGQYDEKKDFERLKEEMEKSEKEQLEKLGKKGDAKVNRVFYLAIPPSEFEHVLDCLKSSNCLTSSGFNRIIVEKPFGKDTSSATKLNEHLEKLFDPNDVFCVDHFLAYEMVQNLTTIRFANPLLEATWNKDFIDHVLINFKEDFGVEGRGSFFDEFGMIRDVFQNHILSMLSLLAMEPPSSASISSLHKAKADVLKHLTPLSHDNTIVGQYTRSEDGKQPGYREDETVDKDSVAHTLIACVLKVENDRWRGVPIVVICGKALDRKVNEIRITYKARPESSQFVSKLFPSNPQPTNQLVIHVTPPPTIALELNLKQTGVKEELNPTRLELDAQTRKAMKGLPDAYERLIFDAIRGYKALFVEKDEVLAGWDVVTDYLHQIEGKKEKPFEYKAGSKLPKEVKELVEKFNVKIRPEDL